MLLESGASHIVVSSSNATRVATAIDRLKSLYPTLSSQSNIAGTPCDVGSTDTLEQNLKALLDFATDNGLHKLDHIVHTAGRPGGGMQPLEQTSAQDFLNFATRHGSIAMLVKLATSKAEGATEATYLNPGPRSSITLTGGSVDIYPQKNWHVNAASAGGTVGLTKALAATVAPVRVNMFVTSRGML